MRWMFCPSGQNIHRMPSAAADEQWGVSPDPELAVPMTDEEYRAWRLFRIRRDLIGDDIDSELAHALDLANGGVPAEFVDRPLGAALEHVKLGAGR
ncbi:MAG TPA: hypothetical protein PJ982_17715, partial [Lacipirellulaceae bacterium]|nr:hypothetical protein [Lacipirellulaceae bacterium]